MSNERDRELTLAVAGLFGPVASDAIEVTEAGRMLTEGLSLRALELFFSRCAHRRAAPLCDGLAALLFDCFGVTKQGPDWPVAAVTRRLDGGGDEGAWVLRADPVHLRAGMGELVLTDGANLRISGHEAESLAAQVNAELGRPGLRLEPLAPVRWYLCLDEAPDVITKPLWDVTGRAVGEHLPAGEDGAEWRALINDIQMILHASPVNRERERRREPAINSIWLWGGGRAPRVATGLWQGVWSDEPLVVGLAQMQGGAGETLPADAHTWLASTGSPGRHLLVLSEGYVAARCADVDGWRRFVGWLEEVWMAPLVDAVRRGRLRSLELRMDSPWRFRLDRHCLRRWWRRSPPFARVISARRERLDQPLDGFPNQPK